jgi:hypothetical protein
MRTESISIVERATPTSCCEARRCTGLANHYRRCVEGNCESKGFTAALLSAQIAER